MLSLELQTAVFDYIDKKTTIQHLEDWYVPRISTLLADPYSDDAEIIASIELLLAEFGDELLTEDELRQCLTEEIRKYANAFLFVTIGQRSVSQNPPSTRLGTSSKLVDTLPITTSLGHASKPVIVG